jgi:Ca2+/Na+ antiporter
VVFIGIGQFLTIIGMSAINGAVGFLLAIFYLLYYILFIKKIVNINFVANDPELKNENWFNDSEQSNKKILIIIFSVLCSVSAITNMVTPFFTYTEDGDKSLLESKQKVWFINDDSTNDAQLESSK